MSSFDNVTCDIHLKNSEKIQHLDSTTHTPTQPNSMSDMSLRWGYDIQCSGLKSLMPTYDFQCDPTHSQQYWVCIAFTTIKSYNSPDFINECPM